MKILGSRVYVNKPEMPETKTILSEDVKRQIDNDLVKQFDRLKVYAIGDSVKDITPGDEVFVEPSQLRNALVIKIDGVDRILLPSHAIMHVW